MEVVYYLLIQYQVHDDLTARDTVVTLTTTSGNITVDAQGNDTDIIFKGTDGSSDTTFLTIDGSDAGTLMTITI